MAYPKHAEEAAEKRLEENQYEYYLDLKKIKKSFPDVFKPQPAGTKGASKMGLIRPKVSTEEMAKRRTKLATVKNPKHYDLRPSERTPTEPYKASPREKTGADKARTKAKAVLKRMQAKKKKKDSY